MEDSDKKIISWWKQKREEIEGRLEDFERVGSEPKERIFEELCFCLLTPQSSALCADRAIRHLSRTGLLGSGTPEEIEKVVSGCGILYANNKSRYIVEARSKLMSENPEIELSSILVRDGFEARERLVKNVKGLGYKEASHFLRNIGYKGLAILDRHILRTMCQSGVIEEIPKTLTKRRYLDIETKFLSYSERIGVPPDALDLVMWSGKTGRVFK